MDMSKKQAEFFTILIIICTVTAAAILIIDYQIKGAILEESNRMRKAIEAFYGQRPAAANGSRPYRNPDNDPAYPADMVGSRATGMEETSTFSALPDGGNPNAKEGRAESSGKDEASGLQDTGQ